MNADLCGEAGGMIRASTKPIKAGSYFSFPMKDDGLKVAGRGGLRRRWTAMEDGKKRAS